MSEAAGVEDRRVVGAVVSRRQPRRGPGRGDRRRGLVMSATEPVSGGVGRGRATLVARRGRRLPASGSSAPSALPRMTRG